MAGESTSREVSPSGSAAKTGKSGGCRPRSSMGLNRGRFEGGLGGLQPPAFRSPLLSQSPLAPAINPPFRDGSGAACARRPREAAEVLQLQRDNGDGRPDGVGHAQEE